MGPTLWRNRMRRQSATYGAKYRVQQIVHKTTRTDFISRTLQAAVIVKLYFRNLNKNKKFLKYKISICLDHTYMYVHIVLQVPYTCNFIAIDGIM